MQKTQAAKDVKLDFDAVVIGAGFGGMYAVRKLRDELGMTVRGYDKAGDVGGTWYWNRYPGALSDTEGFIYCYSFDHDLLQDWNWKTKYLPQPHILSYLNHVADRFDLRRSFQFNTGVEAAHFDEATNSWLIRTDKGDTVRARYVISAMGLLSSTNVPNIKGKETFKGKLIHTGKWPADLDLSGKRVGVIGTGSTGCQFITASAPVVKHLTVFQRSPQYSVPTANGPVTAEYIAECKKNYKEIWKGVRDSQVAFGFTESTVPAMSVSEAEREARFQEAWDYGGGFRFMFWTFGDIAIDPAANEAAASFIRKKIGQIVKDPETARKLTPKDLYAKRPLCDSGYYATFNRDNVTLVDVKANPIAELTPKGAKTADGVEHELDVLVFATGFDAVDGAYTRMDIRGRNNLLIKDKWKNGPKSYLGVASPEFPNFFMVLGPNGPFTNLPPSIEVQVEWISDLIKHMNDSGKTVVEATQPAEDAWTKTCDEIAAMTLFPKAESWIFGANIPGKPNTVMFYMAGLGAYRQKGSEVASKGYEGFAIA
ncbi:MAG: flavin-containing monooxygenase [Panacagrimonas sp.]